jgi:hypothetical protein
MDTVSPEPIPAYRLEDLPGRIAAGIRVNPVTGCWEHQGSPERRGYVRIRWQGCRWLIHRLVYTLLAGPIPDGLTLDHVKARGCRSKACCWPAHLEPVTRGENSNRGDGPTGVNQRRQSCVNGHPYTRENTFMRKEGRRECRACMRDRARQQYRTQAEAEGRTVRAKGAYGLKPSVLSLQRIDERAAS